MLGCYSTALAAGWEDAETFGWFEAAGRSSGEDGPIRQVNIRELLDMQPGWNETEGRTWEELLAARMPMFVAARVLHRTLLNFYLVPALANLGEPDPRARALIFAFSGGRPLVRHTIARPAFDTTALLTLALLGLLHEALEAFEEIYIAHTTLGWLFEEREQLQFHQPSRVKSALELKRLIDSGYLNRFEPPAKTDARMESEVGADLAAFLAAATEQADGEHRQKIVVRPFPLHKVGTLMDELADVSGYEAHLAGCGDVVAALKRAGQLTATEEERAATYLAAQEQPWPSSTTIQVGAVLYLDDVAVSYLQHLHLLGRLKPAGFTAYVSPTEVADGDALMRHEAVSGEALALIETIRSELAGGIASGRVRLARLGERDDDDGEPSSLKLHPTVKIFEAADSVEAFVIDDRFHNRHGNFNTTDGTKVVLTSLDILLHLKESGAISAAAYGDAFIRARRAGFVLTPITADEMIAWMSAAQIVDGALNETAELRAIRESVLRVRMTEVLQLPEEGRWLDGMNFAMSGAIRAQWTEAIPDQEARIRSTWLLSMFDLRGWAHRLEIDLGDPLSRYRAQVLSLAVFPGTIGGVRERYWAWLEDAVLTRLRDEAGGSYDELLETVQEWIAEGGQRAEREGDSND